MDTGRYIRSFNQGLHQWIFPPFRTGTQIIDLINPSDNEVIGKVTLADEIDARNAIAAAKDALSTFSRTTKEGRMDYLQRLHACVYQADGRPRCRDGVGIRRAAGTRQGLQRACGQHLPAFQGCPQRPSI